MQVKHGTVEGRVGDRVYGQLLSNVYVCGEYPSGGAEEVEDY